MDFIAFVIDYEDSHEKELSRREALKLYAEYDPDWAYEKQQARQYKNYERDKAVNPLIKQSSKVITTNGR